LAEIAVLGFAVAISSLRVVFGRHFPTDVIFAGDDRDRRLPGVSF